MTTVDQPSGKRRHRPAPRTGGRGGAGAPSAARSARSSTERSPSAVPAARPQGRPRNLIDPDDGPLHRFCSEVQNFKDSAATRVTFEKIAVYGETHDFPKWSSNTISREFQPALRGGRPPAWDRVQLVVLACGGPEDLPYWERRYDRLCRELGCRNDRTAARARPSGDTSPETTPPSSPRSPRDRRPAPDGGPARRKPRTARPGPLGGTLGGIAIVVALFLLLQQLSPNPDTAPPLKSASMSAWGIVYDTPERGLPYDAAIAPALYSGPSEQSPIRARLSGEHAVVLLACATLDNSVDEARLRALATRSDDIRDRLDRAVASRSTLDQQLLTDESLTLRRDSDSASAYWERYRWFRVSNSELGDGWVSSQYLWIDDTDPSQSDGTGSPRC